MRDRPLALLVLLAACNGGGSTSTDTGSSTQSAADSTGTDTGDVEPTSTGTQSSSTGSVTEDAPTSTGDELVSRRVFITSGTFHGDLKTLGGGSDGVDGADRLCASAADDAGLGGSWVAWVSSSSVDAVTRLASDGRWILLDGTTLVFASRGDIQFGPEHAIDLTETGESLLAGGAADVRVWTNTDKFGANSDDGQNNACDDWSAQTGVAAVGVLFDPALGGGMGLSWTDTKLALGCGNELHLYCFET